MIDNMPVPVRLAIETLLHTASEYKITVAGFAFASEPMCITNFGNCNDAAELHLYRVLCDLFDQKRKAGMAHVASIGWKQ